MSPQAPRRPASSRASTSRPRKIANRVPATDPSVTTSEPTEPTGSTGSTETTTVTDARPTSAATHEPVSDVPAPAAKGSMFAGARLTRWLVVALTVLVVLLLLQGAWFLHHELAKPDAAQGAGSAQGGEPVTLNQTDVDQAVDQAAKDAVVLYSVNYRTYDDDIAKAVDLMTDRFAQKFKATAADSKPGYLKTKASVSAKVVAQGVVNATTTKVQALLFFNEYVTRGTGKQRRITYTPFKLLVTMVHTDHGWLVDDLDTK